jgi:diguanylate cyclase (GGDEF)-like protein/PAS domain S-box-containing protein
MNLAGAFRFSSSLVVVMDAGDGCIVDINPAFETELGYRREELIGKKTIEIGFWPNLETRATIWAHLRSERRVCGEPVVFRDRAGNEHAAMLYSEIFEHDDARYIFSIFQQADPGTALSNESIADTGSYRALFLAAAEGLYRSLPDGGWIDVNPALAKILGYESPAQMLIQTSNERANAMYVDADLLTEMSEQLARKGSVEHFRAQVRRRDGSAVWISENSRIVNDADGRVLFYEGSIVDVSTQLEAEARLQQSEMLYRTLVDNSHEGVFLIQDDVMRFANDALARMLGYPIEELIGMPYSQLLAPESVDAYNSRRSERESGFHDVRNFDVVLLRKDGARRLIHAHAGAVDYNGDIASTGTMRDITDDRRQQLATAEAEHKYHELFRNSITGMFQSHPDGRLLEANEALAHIIGYTNAEELKANIKHMEQLYADPEDRAHFIAELVGQGYVRGSTFYARRGDGSTALVELNAHVARDSEGNVLYIEGSAQDITARSLAEQALQHSEARYRTLVEHSQVGVYMMLEDRYTYVNQAFASMFGYTESELIGADFRILVPTESHEHQEDRYQRQVSGERNRGDYHVTLMRKDGVRLEVVVSAGNIELDGTNHTSGTIRDVTEQRRDQRQLEHNANHDLLTGLPNRVVFEQHLARSIADAHSRSTHDYAVLFLDLDGFKLVNDSLGHASGDLLLIQIAGALRKDLGEQVLVTRYGGDEFTLMPHGSCPRARAEQLAQRVLALLSGSFEINGHRIFSGASLGVVLGHQDYQSPDQVLRDADTAMYRAKASGKSAYVIFDDAMLAAARSRLKIETDLRFALERGEFHVFYQPIVDLRTGMIQGCEALVRWQHPERGLLLPAQFLSVAEETGLIVALDWWVLEQTCRNLLRWQRRYPAHAKLRANVNMDERQFGDPNLIETLRSVIKRTGIDPCALSLEITETIFRGGRAEAEATLHALKELGLSLVVDDFGTGYSSLDSFATSPFDALKVDRSFVRDMATNFRHRAIVRTITGFAEDLGLRLIAEGIETFEQAELLRGLGCVGGQGFFYAPALPLEAMEEALESGLAKERGSGTHAVA